MKLVFKKLFYLYLLMPIALAGFSGTGYAQCTPGIPCTTYTVDNDENKNKAAASAADGPACDADYMNQMFTNAYLHAQREMETNAQVIRKPDSVLEYTCFDRFLGLTNYKTDTIFSETGFWNTRNVTFITGDNTFTETPTGADAPDYPADHLDKALNLLITESLRYYISQNFDHTYLGGSAAIDNVMALGNIGADNYGCTQMAAVWDLSRCTNFGEDDQFFSIGQLVKGDARQLVRACGARPAPVLNDNTPPDSGVAGLTIPITATYIESILKPFGVMTINETNPCPASAATGVMTNDMIRVANNCDLEFSSVELAKGYFEYTRDPYFLADHPSALLSSVQIPAVVWLNTGDLSSAVCGPPIPTGLKMPFYYHAKTTDLFMAMDTVLDPQAALTSVGITGLDYEEHMCPNPSCFYLPGLGICAPP